jgi:hypothetical protein
MPSSWASSNISADVLDLAARVVAAEVDRRADGGAPISNAWRIVPEAVLLVDVGVGQQLVVVELDA